MSDINADDGTTGTGRSARSKWADRPHWLSLALSIVAITISSISLRESRLGRVINEAVNRPMLNREGAELPTRTQRLESIPTHLITSTYFSVRNTGRVEAQAFTASAVVTATKLVDGTRLPCDNEMAKPRNLVTAPSGSVLPGRLFGVTAILYMPTSCFPAVFDVTISVGYASPSGQTYSQTFTNTGLVEDISTLPSQEDAMRKMREQEEEIGKRGN